MYWTGDGVDVDEHMAVSWVQRSAALGYQPAKDWMLEYQTHTMLSALFGGGGSSSDSTDSSSQDRLNQQRNYWESRANREEAYGDRNAAEASRRMIP